MMRVTFFSLRVLSSSAAFFCMLGVKTTPERRTSLLVSASSPMSVLFVGAWCVLLWSNSNIHCCWGYAVVSRRRQQQQPASSRMTTSLKNAASTSSASTSSVLEAILWDMDGVLADTERDGHRPAFNKVFEEYQLDTVWDVDRYGVLLEVGGGKERMTAHWNEVGWPLGLPDDGTRSDKVKELHLRKTDIFMDMINEGTIPLRPGVQRIVDDAIASGIQLAVCSTSNVLAVTNLVQTLLGPDRASHFQIFAGDMVQRKKPAPDVYLMAVQEMQLDKSKCVIVEDSGIGLKAALAAGIKCIVTKSSYTSQEDFSGADLIVNDLGDDPSTGVTLETMTNLLTKANA